MHIGRKWDINAKDEMSHGTKISRIDPFSITKAFNQEIDGSKRPSFSVLIKRIVKHSNQSTLALIPFTNSIKGHLSGVFRIFFSIFPRITIFYNKFPRGQFGAVRRVRGPFKERIGEIWGLDVFFLCFSKLFFYSKSENGYLPLIKKSLRKAK